MEHRPLPAVLVVGGGVVCTSDSLTPERRPGARNQNSGTAGHFDKLSDRVGEAVPERGNESGP